MLAAKSAARWRFGALLGALLLASTEAGADSFAEDSVKAGFIYNFAKFVEWPIPAQLQRTLLICSLGARPLSGKLEALQGRSAQGRELVVRTLTRPSEFRECQVLFIAADEQPRIDPVLQTVSRQPVLTVSDAPKFAQAGGIIGLKLSEGRIRFDINQSSVRRSGLNLSSHLLGLAEELLP